jgi:hypothetical protein
VTALADVRPPGLDVLFRRGATLTLTLTWSPTGVLAGRSFSAELDAVALTTAVSIVGDVMTIVATSAETEALAAGVPVDFELVEAGERIIIGQWIPSDDPRATSSATVEVTQGAATVSITVQGIASSTGDLVVTGDLDVERPLIFWQHPRAQTVPDDLWAPAAWNLRRVTVGDGWTEFTSPAPTTAIAVGSDAAELPQGTIHVDDTTDFDPAGYLAIEVTGTDRIVRYTGTTATSFTGCTFGVGTLATGQTVRQALVEVALPPTGDNGTLAALVAEVAFEANPTGSRGIRVMFLPFGFPGATSRVAAAPDGTTHVQTAEEPAAGPESAATHRIEVYQSSGGPLDSVVDVLAAPRLVAVVVSSYDGTTQNLSD